MTNDARPRKWSLTLWVIAAMAVVPLLAIALFWSDPADPGPREEEAGTVPSAREGSVPLPTRTAERVTTAVAPAPVPPPPASFAPPPVAIPDHGTDGVPVLGPDDPGVPQEPTRFPASDEDPPDSPPVLPAD